MPHLAHRQHYASKEYLQQGQHFLLQNKLFGS